MTGASEGININGTDYRLTVPTKLDYGELEREVVARRSNPLRELAQCLGDFSAEDRQNALRAASDSIAGRSCRASAEEVGAFTGTLEGISYTLYLMLRRNHPEIDTPKKAAELLKGLNEATAVELMDVLKRLTAVELVAAKNSLTTEPIQETEKDPHESRGLESIAT